MKRIAWPRADALGPAEQLRLAPEVFWALTPAEATSMAGLRGRERAALTRAGLADLAARFPDGPSRSRADAE